MKLPDSNSSRAVLIGTSQYRTDSLDDLPAVTNNLSALQEALCDHKILGLPPQHCQIIENPTTQPEMVGPALEAAQEATDTLLVYFAGHGIVGGNGDLYLSLTESEPDPQHSFYTAVSYGILRNALLSSRAKRRIVILDCCYSGRALGVMGAPDAKVLDHAEIDGTYLIAAAPETAAALAPVGDLYTAFSAELIEVFEKGIIGQPKLLTLDSILDHIIAEMRAKGRPIPQKRERNAAGQLPLVRNRALASQKSMPPGYGALADFDAGSLFPNREALSKAKVHRATQAGICGTRRAGGAESIVLSGGYKDDRDYGDVILYTGHGGRDRNTGKQVDDQDPTDPGNAALIQSLLTGLPIRVIRGWEAKTDYSPPEGYSYDGLFLVKDYWSKIGEDGFRILQFRLELIDETPSVSQSISRRTPQGRLAPNQWERVSRGIYLDREIAEQVKIDHNYECQMCGAVLETPGGIRYAEISHIRRLSEPHRGPDIPENMLCLCPNHRVLFDLGAITLDDNLRVVDEITGELIDELRINRRHRVNLEYVQYHRNMHKLTPSPRAQANDQSRD